MSQRSLRSVFGGSLLVVWAAGCGAPADDSEVGDGEETAEISSPIAGGYNEPNTPAVVGIYQTQAGAICTGSLIAPNLVLTARHCVSNVTGDGGVSCSSTTFGAPFGPAGFLVTTDPEMGLFTTKYYDVQEVLTLPITDTKFCGNDQAMLVLTQSIPADVAKPYTPRVDSALLDGEQYYAVGYGATNDAGAGAGTRRRRDNLFVDCAETSCTGDYDYFMRDSEWAGDTGICQGDSGGPAIDLAERVVGVTSRGGQNCSFPIYGSTHSWGQWIKDSAIHAAEVGGYDPPNWALGWPTDPTYNYPIGGDCGTAEAPTCNICVDGECSRFCNDLAPCPSSHECITTDSNQQVCERKPEPPGGDDGTTTTTTGCALAPLETGKGDPTNPVPWLVGGAAVAALLSRRRGAASRG